MLGRASTPVAPHGAPCRERPRLPSPSLPFVVSTALSTGLLAALVAVSACKRDGPDGEGALDPELEQRIEHCVSTLERLSTVAGSERAAALARGCPYACGGLDAYGRQPRDDDTASRSIAPLAEECRFFCSARAQDSWQSAEPGAEFSALLAECDRDYYGLREETELLLSDTWFVLHRIGEWLADARSSVPADGALAERLDRATANVHIPIPVPPRSEGHFELARGEAIEPADAAFYVIVGTDEVRAAAMRVARLRGRALELRPVPGGSFPGQLLPASHDAMEGAYLELERALRSVHRAPEVTAAPPLLLADGALAVERLFEIAGHLGQPEYRLGVAGRRALAHVVSLARIPEFGSAAPAVELIGGAAHVPGTDEPIPVRERGELDEALRHLVALRAPLDRIEVSADGASTVTDLVSLADAAARARIRAIAFAAPAGNDED